MTVHLNVMLSETKHLKKTDSSASLRMTVEDKPQNDTILSS